MRAPILALLLLALASSRQAFAAETSDTIAGVQANCLSATSTPPLTAGATNAECQTCVSTIGNLDGLDSQRMYACYDVCQDPALFTGPTTGAQCISCIENTDYTVQACKDCMSASVSAVDGTADCYDCLSHDPWAGETLTQAEQYKRNNYFFACAQCSTIPTDEDGGNARAQCYECISTKEARLQSAGGMLTYAEYTSDGFDGRDNDFGACVFLANQSYLVASGSLEVTGEYANCVPGEGEVITGLTSADCIQCMSIANQQQAALYPDAPSKSYGCADYCQSPDYYPPGSDVATLSAACKNCLENPAITQAWACGNCMKTAVPSACFECIGEDPYGGQAGNYNWACGMCAQVEDEALRNLCTQCIQSQTGSDGGDIDHNTESNICSCIDLIQNNGLHVDRPLTAMEKTCYQPFTKRDSDGNLLPSPAIPWGDDVVDINTSACVICMRDASVGITLPGLNKAYACHEYCQDPDLVANSDQGQACSDCVTNENVQDPSACKTCMAATDNDFNRAKCFECVKTPGITHGSNHAWGCGQCAQLPTSVQAFCFKCLSDDVLDPCECIDGIKNGTLVSAPGESLCGTISTANGQNKVVDGCFEGCAGYSGTCGWTFDTNSNSGYQGFLTETGFFAQTGCNSYYYGGAVGSDGVWYQPISGISAGSYYQVSWWMLSNGNSGDVNIIVDGVAIASFASPNTGGAFQQFSATFAGASHSPSLQFAFGVRNDPSYTYLTGFYLSGCIQN